MIAALLLLLAAAPHGDVINQEFDIPANDWQYLPSPIVREPAMVDCMFQANHSGAKVRLVLVSEADLSAWQRSRPHDEIAATNVGPRGALRMAIHDLDTYVVIENRGPRPAHVRLRIFLEQAQVRYLSRARRATVILISFGVFFAIASLSARKLLRALRE